MTTIPYIGKTKWHKNKNLEQPKLCIEKKLNKIVNKKQQKRHVQATMVASVTSYWNFHGSCEMEEM